jgi:hypothetical protein
MKPSVLYYNDPNQFLILELPMLLLRKLKNKSMKLEYYFWTHKDGNINGNLVTVILVLIN